MSTTPDDNAKYTVLYVDDEEQALKYFRKGLEKDFPICTAANAAQAIAELEKNAVTIGVVITDQRMPGKSGVTLLAEVRERWPSIVRILVTAYTDIDSAIAAVNAGAVYKYINKPVDFPSLRQTLADALKVHRENVYRDALVETLRQLEEQRHARQAAEAQREQLQQKLIAASREAGRAEVATGILHNVGNVLNSMNVTAAIVNNTLRQSRVGNLCKGLAMLEEHARDLANFITFDERGQRLPGYLLKLAPVLTEEQNIIANAMASLNRNIEHIVQVVQVQQSHAKDVVLQQPVNPADLMEEALRVNQTSIDEQKIQITREYGQSPIVLLDQHKVLQILINLIANAVNALKEQAVSMRQLKLRILERSGSPSPLICFEVIDTGVGIAPENLTRIFAYGFTTRSEGHGFGLHSAANAAKEMGGSLTASSGGPGCGATFALELPLRRDCDVASVEKELPQKVSV